ncbi:MAG: FixG Ig-like domain-containing protein, partial [Planctomycetota bacterium]
CIDACDSVMDKIGRPRGLIRYGSQASVLDRKPTRFLRVRTFVYPALVAVLLAAFVVLLVTRAPAFVSVLRGPGAPYAVLEDGSVTNPAKIKIQNRTGESVSYTMTVSNAEGGLVRSMEPAVVVEPGETVSEPVLLSVPRSVFTGGRFEAAVTITGADGFEKTVPHEMMGPKNAGRGAGSDGGAS